MTTFFLPFAEAGVPGSNLGRASDASPRGSGPRVALPADRDRSCGGTVRVLLGADAWCRDSVAFRLQTGPLYVLRWCHGAGGAGHQAEGRRWLVTVVEQAGLSAEQLQRPGIEAALRLIETGKAQAQVAAKRGRLSRLVADLSALIATAQTQGWALVA